MKCCAQLIFHQYFSLQLSCNMFYRVSHMDPGHFKELVLWWLRFWCQTFSISFLWCKKCHFDILPIFKILGQILNLCAFFHHKNDGGGGKCLAPKTKGYSSILKCPQTILDTLYIREMAKPKFTISFYSEFTYFQRI